MSAPFRFAVMGTGGVADSFCRAVRLVEGCEVAAVASRTVEKARAFAQPRRIPHAYGDYAQMLDEVRPDAVYIATVTSAHYELILLCLGRGVPVLCEKAMCVSGEQAKEALRLAREHHTFLMEATWSRFLPPLQRAKAWLDQGLIGQVRLSECAIGFAAPRDPENRYYSRALGGGAAYDLLIYCYELTRFFLPGPADAVQMNVHRGDTGVDLSEQVLLRFSAASAALTASIVCPLEERLVLYGEKGRIVIPNPHFASEALLYDENRQLIANFRDETTVHGFTYEIEETMRCVRAGLVESPVVPHQLTLDCAQLFDRINDA